MIVGADCLRPVCNVLLGFGIEDLTVTDCANSGARLRFVRSYRTAAWVPDLEAKYLIEVIVPRDSVTAVLRLIGDAKGQSAHGLDGFRVSSIDEVIPIQDSGRPSPNAIEWRCDRAPTPARCEHDGS